MQTWMDRKKMIASTATGKTHSCPSGVDSTCQKIGLNEMPSTAAT